MTQPQNIMGVLDENEASNMETAYVERFTHKAVSYTSCFQQQERYFLEIL